MAAALPWQCALVVGLGQSGLAAARLLLQVGVPTVRGYDQRADIPGLPSRLQPFIGQDTVPDQAMHGADLVVLSPGVTPGPVRERVAHLAGAADVFGELSLGLSLLQGPFRAALPPAPTALVTGTNGKSTVTALTGTLLQASGRRVFTGGNLGTPLTTLIADALDNISAWPDNLVLECSSFQLETMNAAPCEVAMVLNVSPDHLDRYASVAEYAHTKARVFEGLRADGLGMLDAGDPWTATIAAETGRDLVLVNGDHPPRLGTVGDESLLLLPQGIRLPRDLMALPGRHNGTNALFALMAARHLGVDESACREGLRSFSGLPHRMQKIRELDGVVYYDDSKATNVAAALAGLDGFERPFVLIAGGVRKGDDLGPLRDLLARHGRGLVTIGTSAAEFEALVRDIVPVDHGETMGHAVSRARTMAQPGDAVVLAPACASYDQFRDYTHRGQAFAAAVETLSPSPRS